MFLYRYTCKHKEKIYNLVVFTDILCVSVHNTRQEVKDRKSRWRDGKHNW